tara:strand:- start:2017 stop:2913 length:897 start_codon:yes stop_codon:yes gene_type:complete
MAFIKGLYAEFNQISNRSGDLKELHTTIGRQMDSFMDYHEMAVRILGKERWNKLSRLQHQEFQRLLSALVRKTYVQRFRPGRKFAISYDDRVRMLKDGRAQIRTTIEFGRSSVSAYYSMYSNSGGWSIYDIVVDEASQVQIYRRSFQRILKKEGWRGLIKRMRISAGLKEDKPFSKKQTEFDKLAAFINNAGPGDYIIIVPLRDIDPNGAWKPGAFCAGQKYKATITNRTDINMKASAFLCATIISVPMKTSKVLNDLKRSFSNKSLCASIDCKKSKVYTKGKTKSVFKWLGRGPKKR